MIFKKILCGLLASLMLATTLVSCNSDDTEKETGSSTESSSKKEEGSDDGKESLGLPEDLSFEGEDVTFLTRDAKEWSTTDIYSAGGGSDTISDAVFKRNELVRSRLGVSIKEIKVDDATLSQQVQQTTAGNLNAFQAVVSRSLEASSLAVSGYLRDLNSKTIQHLDLSQSWWDQNISSELSMGGHLYYATGDIVTSDNNATFSILFNKTLANDSKLPNMYNLVKNNEWTMEQMLSFMTTVGSDSGASDRTYGLLYTNDTAFSIYYGAGIKAVNKIEDSFVAQLDTKLADDVADIAKQIFSDSISLNLAEEEVRTGETLMQLGQTYFGGGKALFYGDVLQCVERMRSYDVVFGVLPYPMYDTNQSGYYHMMHLEGSVVSIPRSGAIRNEVLEKTTATLEAMAYYSVDTLTKQYYEINLTSKDLRDAESAPMIDLILSTRVYDLAYYFDLTTSQGNITHKLAACMLPDAKSSVSSVYRGMSTMLGKRIDAMITEMNKTSDMNQE